MTCRHSTADLLSLFRCPSSALAASSPAAPRDTSSSQLVFYLEGYAFPAFFLGVISSVLVVLVTKSCPTLCDPMDRSPPGSSAHGDSPGKSTGVSSHSLLQGIFLTQGLSLGLRHCRQIFLLLGATREVFCTWNLNVGLSQGNLLYLNITSEANFSSEATLHMTIHSTSMVPPTVNSLMILRCTSPDHTVSDTQWFLYSITYLASPYRFLIGISNQLFKSKNGYVSIPRYERKAGVYKGNKIITRNTEATKYVLSRKAEQTTRKMGL